MSKTIEEVQEELDFYKNLVTTLGLGFLDQEIGYQLHYSNGGPVVYVVQEVPNPDTPPTRVLTAVRFQTEDVPTAVLSPLVVETQEEPESAEEPHTEVERTVG